MVFNPEASLRFERFHQAGEIAVCERHDFVALLTHQVVPMAHIAQSVSMATTFPMNALGQLQLSQQGQRPIDGHQTNAGADFRRTSVHGVRRQPGFSCLKHTDNRPPRGSHSVSLLAQPAQDFLFSSLHWELGNENVFQL
jgi:hypothetical protein